KTPNCSTGSPNFEGSPNLTGTGNRLITSSAQRLIAWSNQITGCARADGGGDSSTGTQRYQRVITHSNHSNASGLTSKTHLEPPRPDKGRSRQMCYAQRSSPHTRPHQARQAHAAHNPALRIRVLMCSCT